MLSLCFDKFACTLLHEILNFIMLHFFSVVVFDNVVYTRQFSMFVHTTVYIKPFKLFVMV